MSNSSSKGTALITGASGGIGAVYADCLTKRGYDLILVAHSKVTLQALAASLSSATGRHIIPIRGGPQQRDGSRESGNRTEGRSEHLHACQ
jgi:hypothetical protein